MFNHVFGVIISVDEGGTVCVWDASSGARDSRFMHAHGESRLTAACLDHKQRRLLTAANDGSIKMWNFNNGSLLRRFVHPLHKQEITCLMFCSDEKRGLDSVYAAGWNCRVFVWEDDNEEVVRGRCAGVLLRWGDASCTAAVCA
jgi:WD40 repeat protein